MSETWRACYGRAVWGHRKMRRFLYPVRQLCTVPPTRIGVREAEFNAVVQDYYP
ncbi:hypothetical protein [Pseudomonas luteola]|uniref:hypothetical protein n=1 Tax=Pseudomonas luteola TaxID=47886 RepID=UPI00163A1F02|nr:hypothetical protein [Pseudomonas luteola]